MSSTTKVTLGVATLVVAMSPLLAASAAHAAPGGKPVCTGGIEEGSYPPKVCKPPKPPKPGNGGGGISGGTGGTTAGGTTTGNTGGPDLSGNGPGTTTRPDALPFTGANVLAMTLGGGGLLLAGGAIVVVSRRRHAVSPTSLN